MRILCHTTYIQALMSALKKVTRVQERAMLSIAEVTTLRKCRTCQVCLLSHVSGDRVAHLRSWLEMLAFQVQHSAYAELALVAAA